MKNDDLQDIFKNPQGSITKKIAFSLLAAFVLFFIYTNFFSGMPSSQTISVWIAKNKLAFDQILLSDKKLNYQVGSANVKPTDIEVIQVLDWETGKYFDLDKPAQALCLPAPNKIDKKSEAAKDNSNLKPKKEVSPDVKKLLPDYDALEDKSNPAENQLNQVEESTDKDNQTSIAQKVLDSSGFDKSNTYFAKGWIKFIYKTATGKQEKFAGIYWIMLDIKKKKAIPLFITAVKRK